MEQKYPAKNPSNGKMIYFRSREISIKVMYAISTVDLYKKNSKMSDEFLEVVLPKNVLIKFSEL